MSFNNVSPGKDIPNDFNVIIEIPAQSDPVKYEADKETGMLHVDRFVGTGMRYPANYGFIPQTLSEDGDPIDVLVLSPVAVASGAVIRCRPVGALLMEDNSGTDEKIIAVPVDALHDPPFSLLHPDDACAAMVAALERRADGPFNIVGPGAASPWQTARLGGRLPVPVFGPMWGPTAQAVEFMGAAIAPHVVELLRFGRTANGAKAADVLGLDAIRSTQSVVRDLYEWAEVVPIVTAREAVA